MIAAIVILCLSYSAVAQFSYTRYLTTDCSGDPYSIDILNQLPLSSSPFSSETSGACKVQGSISYKYENLASAVYTAPVINRPSAIATYYLYSECNASTNPISFNLYGYSVTFLNADGKLPGASVFTCNGTNGLLGFTEKKPPNSGADEVTYGQCQANTFKLNPSIYPLFADTECIGLSTNSPPPDGTKSSSVMTLNLITVAVILIGLMAHI
jgi:hypothetical protein